MMDAEDKLALERFYGLMVAVVFGGLSLVLALVFIATVLGLAVRVFGIVAG